MSAHYHSLPPSAVLPLLSAVGGGLRPGDDGDVVVEDGVLFVGGVLGVDGVVDHGVDVVGLVDEAEDRLLLLAARLRSTLRGFYQVAEAGGTAVAAGGWPAATTLAAEDAFADEFSVESLPVLPVGDDLLFFSKFPFKIGQQFLIILIIVLNPPLRGHFAKFFKIIPVELDLDLIDDHLRPDLLVGFLQHAVLFVLECECGLYFGLLGVEVAVLLVEVGDDELETGHLAAAEGLAREGFVFGVVTCQLLFQFASRLLLTGLRLLRTLSRD
jgi:hypothetical protein